MTEKYFYNIHGLPRNFFGITLDKKFVSKAMKKKPTEKYLKDIDNELEYVRNLWGDKYGKEAVSLSFHKGCLLHVCDVYPRSGAVNLGAPCIEDQLNDKERNNHFYNKDYIFYNTHNVTEYRQSFALLSIFVIWFNKTKELLEIKK